MDGWVQKRFLYKKQVVMSLSKFFNQFPLSTQIYGRAIFMKTRPVWTGFKIAVRRKLQTHYYKVRCLDAIIICNN